ncbi:MAG: choline transporter [SAR324 cluster bacterium]|uniref:Choline transporter n=1 Tax=SAR324 cluster bacterium TaxID=2024889 RepID=A0A2A4T3Q0_9DELT|nr:MAG: choline transporter [SAR324 cluster bacterium]
MNASTKNEEDPVTSLKIQPTVFWVSAGLAVLFVALSLFNVDQMAAFFGEIQSSLSIRAGWFYILSVNFFLLFTIYLLFSRFGTIRIGGPEAKPEFSSWAWFAMLFSAGMGIGLVFYSVAEPMYHYASPPMGTGKTIEAAKTAMNVTFFHWGLHAWAIYAIVGLSLAYFSFNKGLPLTIRSAFYPLLKERIYGPIGHTIDIIAVFATLFGLATSLGLGVQQVNAGLNYLFGIEINTTTQIILIALITCLAIVSVVLGLDKGVRRLSEINMVLALLLMLFVLFLGPTLFILDSLVQNVGSYFQQLLALSTWTEAYQESTWQHGWTIFYWAWWIAWSPFVGMFIARISKGRTVREFLIGVLLVPTLMTFVWLTVFGGAALHEELRGAGGIADAVGKNVSTALFVLLERFPFSSLTSLIGIIVIITFFVTSSDSGSLVVDTITSGGHPNPPARQKVFWAVMEGVIAAVLMLSGGLKALQAGSILTALPFTFVLLFMCYGLLKAFREEKPLQVAETANLHQERNLSVE